MKKTIILLLILSVSNLFAQTEVNGLFFDLPLNLERNTIYSKIKEKFNEEKDNYIVTRNDTIIKTFSGYLDKKKTSLISKELDSVKIQLSTGSSSIESEKYYQDILIIWSYYYFSKSNDAKKFYKTQKKRIENITNNKSYHYKNYIDNKKNGYSDKFESLNDNEAQLSILYSKKRKKYIVKLEYERNEGEKQLKYQFRKKKPLIYKELDKTELYYLNNIDTIPITKRCLMKNDKTINCFNNSLSRQIMKDIDFDDYLISGKYRILLTFVVNNESQIINIKVHHENKELVGKIKESINQMEIVSSGFNMGKSINTFIRIPLTFTIP